MKTAIILVTSKGKNPEIKQSL